MRSFTGEITATLFPELQFWPLPAAFSVYLASPIAAAEQR